MKILVIKDKAIEAFSIPMVLKTVGEGIRLFTDEINRKDTPMNQHPTDYDLYEIGDYYEDSGEITPTNPILRMRGEDVNRSVS